MMGQRGNNEMQEGCSHRSGQTLLSSRAQFKVVLRLMEHKRKGRID